MIRTTETEIEKTEILEIIEIEIGALGAEIGAPGAGVEGLEAGIVMRTMMLTWASGTFMTHQGQGQVGNKGSSLKRILSVSNNK